LERTTQPDIGAPLDSCAAVPLILKLVERLPLVAARHDTTPGAVAVAWTLRNPAVNGAIVGFRRPEQVNPILAAANLTLDKHDSATLLRRK
jgi:aryl-alcohol dehydrogenase-like predicted oxidoreductase